jgi:hypothetical protein
MTWLWAFLGRWCPFAVAFFITSLTRCPVSLYGRKQLSYVRDHSGVLSAAGGSGTIAGAPDEAVPAKVVEGESM